MNEGSLSSRPVLPKWSGRITGYATDNEESIVIKKVSNTYVDARVNVVFINENTLQNMIKNVVRHPCL